MTPRISVVIPWHFMENWDFFLTRCIKSIEKQRFSDYEVVLVKHSTMPITSNRAIESARGELIKVLYMDDYLAHEDSLQEISDSFGGFAWLVSGCLHDMGNGPKNYHEPRWTDDISTGNNCIGSPSVLTMSRECNLLFDSRLSWMLDCDLYKRLYEKNGPPKILNTPNVVIGLHKGQTSNVMPDSEKQKEVIYMLEKHNNVGK